MVRFPLRRAASSVAAPLAFILTGSLAVAETTDPANLPEIVVTSQHLDEGLSHIQTQTGASTPPPSEPVRVETTRCSIK